MIIMLTYDLNKIKDYPKLYKAIGELGPTIRDPGLDSVWFIQTSYTFVQIENHLLKNIDVDDRIFFVKVNPGQRGGYLHKDIWAWINARS